MPPQPQQPPARPAARRVLAAAIAAAALAAHAAPAAAQVRDGFRSGTAVRGDDIWSPFQNFGFSVNIRGGSYDSAAPCSNGYMTLGSIDDPAGCDFIPPATGLTGLAQTYGTAVSVLFRDLNSAPPASGVLRWGAGTVDGRQAFGFTWDNVFTFGTTVPNLFQAVFINRGMGDFDLEFNYSAIGPTGGTLAGVADDGGFSGTPFNAPVTAGNLFRVTQQWRGGNLASQATVVIPEPSTVALTVTGLGALAAAGLRRRRAAARAA